MPPPRSGSPARLLWADVAKGISIALVVLHHLITKHFDLLVPESLDILETGWLALTLSLKPLRMPLFFVVSGLLAASALERPWLRVLGPRVLGVYQLYGVWLLIHAVVFSYAQALPMNRTRGLGEFLLDLVYASTGLWYLYALAVYFLMARLLRRFDRRLVLLLAVALAIVSWVLPIEAVNRASVLQHFVYFLLGSRFPTFVTGLADLRTRHLIPVLTGAYLLLWVVVQGVGAPRGTRILLLSIVAVPLGIRCAVALAKRPWVARPASFIGRRTLPVYVLHVPLLSLLHYMLVILRPSQLLAPPLLAGYPVVATLVLVAASLAVHQAAGRIRLGWLFRRPGWSTASAAQPASSRAGNASV